MASCNCAACGAVDNYYTPRLGKCYILYLVIGILCFIAVTVLAFIEGARIEEQDGVFEAFMHLADTYFALGALTLMTGFFTVVDFFTRGTKLGSYCRVTPFTIACGTLATFLGIVLWAQTENPLIR